MNNIFPYVLLCNLQLVNRFVQRFMVKMFVLQWGPSCPITVPLHSQTFLVLLVNIMWNHHANWFNWGKFTHFDEMPIEILQSIQQKWIVKLKSLSIKKLYVLFVLLDSSTVVIIKGSILKKPSNSLNYFKYHPRRMCFLESYICKS